MTRNVFPLGGVVSRAAGGFSGFLCVSGQCRARDMAVGEQRTGLADGCGAGRVLVRRQGSEPPPVAAVPPAWARGDAEVLSTPWVTR